MTKPLLWKWGSCGYVGGGRIFQNGAPIFLGEASNNLSRWQIIFEKFQNSEWTHPLTKLNKNKSCYVDSIWLW
jgi:hypothetical protein